MNCSEAQELLEVYFLRALPRDEALEVEAHLRACVDCRARAEVVQQTVQLMRHAQPLTEPPPGLRARILEAARADLADLRPVARPSSGMSRGFVREALARFFGQPSGRWAAVAALLPLMLSGWLAFQMMTMREQVRHTTQELNQTWKTAQDATEIVGRAFQAGGEMASLQATPMAPGASGMLYYSPGDSEGVIVVNGLPESPPGMVYRCWLWRGEERMNGGTLYRENDGRGMVVVKAPMPLRSMDVVRIVHEPEESSSEPRGQPYLWGRLSGA